MKGMRRLSRQCGAALLAMLLTVSAGCAFTGEEVKRDDPNAFFNSIPEITGKRENGDGTVTWTVDAVCEPLGDDAFITHELTLRFSEEGGIVYLENRILGDGLEKLPDYQHRFGTDYITR